MKRPKLELVSHVLCPYVQRSVITLEEKNIPYIRTDIDLSNKPSWFKQKSPMGKVPILLVDNTHILFESAIICEYLDEITSDSLHPDSSLEKAYHRAWIEFGSSILSMVAAMYNAKEASNFQAIHTEIKNKFELIERELNGYTYFSGEKFHLIDAAYAPIFRYFDIFDNFTRLDTFDLLPSCQVWRKGLKQRGSVQAAVGSDYSSRLIEFLLNRNSYVSHVIGNSAS